jgi:hypothetical protein
MTFTDYVQTVTQDKIVPKIVDTILGGNIIALKFLSNGKPWSGETLKFPIKYVKNSTSQGSFDGFDTFDTTKVNTRTKLSFSPTGYYQSIVLSGMDVDVNSVSESQVLDLVKVEMESGMQDMLDSLGTMFYAQQSGKAFNGIRDIVDDGNGTATYGGLARGTYSSINSTVTAAAGGALTLAVMGSQYDAATVGSQKPDLGITTETVWGLYESLIQPTIVTNVNQNGYAQVTRNGVAQSRAALNGEIGFDALFFRGMPIVKDEKCTSGYLYMLNTNSIQWYGLKSHKYSNIDLSSSNIEGGPYENNTPKSFGFVWTGLKEPVNQYAEIGQIMLLGNLVGTNPRLSSLWTGLTTA